ncbi:MAG: hypothetical protein WCG10_02615 [Chlamydiota bacterium]
MAITPINQQLPRNLLALEGAPSSKFSKIDNLEGHNNIFNKIATAVMNIFIALRNWILKSFSKNIKAPETEKVIDKKSDPVIPILSPEEITLLKNRFILLSQCKYAEKYEEKTGKLPTEKQILKIFNDKKIKQLNRKADQLIKKLKPEEIIKFKEGIRLASTQAQEPSNQTPAPKSIFSEMLDQSKKALDHLATFSGVAGVGVGLATGLTTNLVSNVANSCLVQPILNKFQEFGGSEVTRGLQFAAISNRAINWYNQLKSSSAAEVTAATLFGAIIAPIPILGPRDLVSARKGMDDYMKDAKTAISNESGYFLRKCINEQSHKKVLAFTQTHLLPEGADPVSFQYGYTAGFMSTFLLGPVIIGYLGLNSF